MIVGLGLILDRSAPEEIVDAIWALASPEVFTMLTEGRGWPIADAETWLVTMCGAAIDNCRA
jgi:hypothetical protein